MWAGPGACGVFRGRKAGGDRDERGTNDCERDSPGCRGHDRNSPGRGDHDDSAGDHDSAAHDNDHDQCDHTGAPPGSSA